MPRWLGLTSRAMSSTASGTTPFHRDRQIKLLFPDRPLVCGRNLPFGTRECAASGRTARNLLLSSASPNGGTEPHGAAVMYVVDPRAAQVNQGMDRSFWRRSYRTRPGDRGAP